MCHCYCPLPLGTFSSSLSPPCCSQGVDLGAERLRAGGHKAVPGTGVISLPDSSGLGGAGAAPALLPPGWGQTSLGTWALPVSHWCRWDLRSSLCSCSSQGCPSPVLSREQQEQDRPLGTGTRPWHPLAPRGFSWPGSWHLSSKRAPRAPNVPGRAPSSGISHPKSPPPVQECPLLCDTEATPCSGCWGSWTPGTATFCVSWQDIQENKTWLEKPCIFFFLKFILNNFLCCFPSPVLHTDPAEPNTVVDLQGQKQSLGAETHAEPPQNPALEGL